MNNMPIHCPASTAPDLYRIAVQIAELTNPVLFWDLRQMDDLERRAAIADLEAEFEELTG